MMYRSCLALLFMVPLLPAIAQQESPDADEILAGYREAAVKRWEDDIKKLESRDESEPDPADAILFVGSSSIRRWQDLAIDMSPYRTIQRGYGGAKYSDLAVYAERLICPHDYRALVIFVGNDVSGKPTDHTPDQVEQLVRHVVGVARRHRPQSPVLLIEVTPTEKRWAVWPRIRELNARLREIALATPHTYFLPTAGHFLRPQGTPRTELFAADNLHLNPQGYDLWSELIRRRLGEIFRSMVAVPPAEDTSAAGQE